MTVEAPLAIPITAIGSTHDVRADEDQVRAWREVTTAAFTQHTLDGGHFEVLSDKGRAHEIITAALAAHRYD